MESNWGGAVLPYEGVGPARRRVCREGNRLPSLPARVSSSTFSGSRPHVVVGGLVCQKTSSWQLYLRHHSISSIALLIRSFEMELSQVTLLVTLLPPFADYNCLFLCSVVYKRIMPQFFDPLVMKVAARIFPLYSPLSSSATKELQGDSCSTCCLQVASGVALGSSSRLGSMKVWILRSRCSLLVRKDLKLTIWDTAGRGDGLENIEISSYYRGAQWGNYPMNVEARTPPIMTASKFLFGNKVDRVKMSGRCFGQDRERAVSREEGNGFCSTANNILEVPSLFMENGISVVVKPTDYERHNKYMQAPRGGGSCCS
ncbi:hypothetical protein NC652_020294 [Populus alba x Populus x berolinensis]|nr:hypothetical protein NC652_020294 [Populus alba x Populus x berolinensis]